MIVDCVHFFFIFAHEFLHYFLRIDYDCFRIALFFCFTLKKHVPLLRQFTVNLSLFLFAICGKTRGLSIVTPGEGFTKDQYVVCL